MSLLWAGAKLGETRSEREFTLLLARTQTCTCTCACACACTCTCTCQHVHVHVVMLYMCMYMWTNPGSGYNPGYNADLGTSFLALSHCERVLLNPASSCRRFLSSFFVRRNQSIQASLHPHARKRDRTPRKAKAMAKAHTLTEVRTHSRNRHHQPSDQPSEATGQHRTQGQTDAHHDHDSPEGYGSKNISIRRTESPRTGQSLRDS